MVSPGTHLAKHHESQSITNESQFKKKQGVINWKCLGLICNQTVNRETDAKTPYYSLLIIKKQSFYILKAQKLLNYFCIFKQQPQKSHKWDILPKNLEIDASFFASYRTHGIIIILFCTLEIFMHQGCRGNKIINAQWPTGASLLLLNSNESLV